MLYGLFLSLYIDVCSNTANQRHALHTHVLRGCNGCNLHALRNLYHHECYALNNGVAKYLFHLWLFGLGLCVLFWVFYVKTLL